MPQLRVLIAVKDEAEAKKLGAKLLKAGHLVIGRVWEAKDVLRLAFETQPDLVLLDPALPDYGGLGVAQVIDDHRLAPIVFVTADCTRLAQLSGTGWLFSYLLVPYSDDDLYLAVEVARSNFKRLLALEQENMRLKKTLESRKLVERAKGLLVEKKGFTEPEAYRYLQKLSMDTCRPLAGMAREVIEKLSSGQGRKGRDKNHQP